MSLVRLEREPRPPVAPRDALVRLQAQARHHRRRAQVAEDRLRLRTLARAQADHRLKTTLAVLTGWARTLDESWARLKPEDRREAVAGIRRTAEELTAHAQQLLEGARAEMAVAELYTERMDLAEVLRASTTAFSGVSELHPVRYEGPRHVWARVDAGALQQVLGHLIENGVKYSPDGGAIVLRARSSGPWTELRVVDAGIGIPNAPEAPDIFAAFQRGVIAGNGAGLGLYIVANLVEAMGGTVTARRNRGGPGSTFLVRLPRSHG